MLRCCGVVLATMILAVGCSAELTGTGGEAEFPRGEDLGPAGGGQNATGPESTESGSGTPGGGGQYRDWEYEPGADSEPESEPTGEWEGYVDYENCVKIEGSEIGSAGMEIQLPTQTVYITDWMEKSTYTKNRRASNEYIGFQLKTVGGLALEYEVKCGTETWGTRDSEWMNPEGEYGHGISNIVFCQVCKDEHMTECGAPMDDPNCEHEPEHEACQDNW